MTFDKIDNAKDELEDALRLTMDEIWAKIVERKTVKAQKGENDPEYVHLSEILTELKASRDSMIVVSHELDQILVEEVEKMTVGTLAKINKSTQSLNKIKSDISATIKTGQSLVNLVGVLDKVIKLLS